ncbi:MAG: chorismate mutase, partial [Rhizobiales bacterium]|nr:chorismate mutase [Hyphomicrobiales bacterium]
MPPSETSPALESDAARLAEIRATIDRLDAEVHQRLIERGAAIASLIRVKGTSRPGAAFRPGREADMMRRLVARHAGALPLPTVEHIWREIITTFTRLQAPFDVAYDAGVNDDAMRDVARFLFGFSVALHRQGDALSTINHIKESGTDLGLVSLEQPASAGAWWRALGRQSAPRIMALAPFIRIAGRPAGHPALVISPELADPTPPDLSVYAVTTLGADPAREIASAGGSVLATSGRERLIVLPAGASAAAIAARAGLDDIARVGGLFRGMAIGEESADAALYQR